MHFSVELDALPEVIEPEETGRIPVEVTTQPGCAGLIIVDWFLRYSGRSTRGTFDLNIRDPDVMGP